MEMGSIPKKQTEIEHIQSEDQFWLIQKITFLRNVLWILGSIFA